MQLLHEPVPRLRGVGYSPTSEIDGGGGTTYRWGQSSPIRLVFWVELGPGPIVMGSGGPKAWWGADSWV
jgi:hypothetical protein